MVERNLVAVSIKHTEYKWKFGKPLCLWGYKRTKDDEERCFAGYTSYLNVAEIYSIEEWQEKYKVPWIKTDKPVEICIGFCKKYKEYDTVLVTLDQCIQYYKAACLPFDRPKGE